MAKTDVFQRLLDSGISFTAMSQARAEAIVKDLVKQGALRRKETETMVATLMDRGREGAERIAQMVEEEVGRQVARIAAQLDELETRITVMTGGSPAPKSDASTAPAAKSVAKRGARKAAAAPASAPAAATPVAPKKTAAKKTAAKKTAAKKVAAPKQAAAKKVAAPKQAATTATGAPSTQASPRKRAAKKAAAKQASA